MKTFLRYMVPGLWLIAAIPLSMPVITILGIWTAALVGSGVYGRLLQTGKMGTHDEALATG